MDPKKSAQLFDIRNVTGALMGLLGLFLLVVGLVADPQEGKTGGINANLWVGIALLVVGVVFLIWNRLDPVSEAKVEEMEREDAEPSRGH